MIVASVLLGLPLLGTGVLFLRRVIQERVDKRRRCLTPGRIEELDFWPLGGSHQAVQIRGANVANPLLIYVHGGPGLPAMPLAHAFQTRWEQHFTVVHWDQRNAGRTLTANGVEQALSLDVFAADGIALTRMLGERFPGRAIALVGHSWGTAVAVRMLQMAPDLFAAYLAIGQVSDFLVAERYGYETVLAEATRREKKTTVASLSRFANYPTGASLTPNAINAVRGAEMALGFAHHNDPRAILRLFGLAFASPDYSWRDFLGLLNRKAQKASLNIALSELPRFIDKAAGAKLKCPVIMVGGAFDLFTPTPMARDFFETIDAPCKEFVEATHLAHFGPLEDAEFFNAIVVDRLLPLVVSTTSTAGSS